ncbi:MAG TPA: ATP-binding protein [Candidatus Binataceae bacterium]|nr:ATP-binding protein [Candidatus Binataceae bacterium]
MKTSKLCGCCRASKTKFRREPTDAGMAASGAEIESLRRQLLEIEQTLARLFGNGVYSRAPEAREAREAAANLIDEHFDGIVEQWGQAILSILGAPPLDENNIRAHLETLANSLIRFNNHLRDPDDLATYIYLRRHCQEGMLARAKPSQFNAIHIALKQIILAHVAATMHGKMQERVRNAVVAAVDERRLMVSQFYIESREHLLRASEEKYRNSINHAPDPMYEIEPGTWKVLGMNAAAIHMFRDEPKHEVIGQRLVDFIPPELRDSTIKSLENVLHHGSDQTLDLPIGPYYVDVNSALISYGDKQFIQMTLHDVTQRREMLESLLRTERLAAVGTFAAGVAHEVNNPLASISSLVQSLLSAETDLQRRTTLHTILSQITRISGTLKDLVNFARPSAAQHKIIDINQMVTETLRIITYDKRFRGISVEPELDPNLLPAYADDNEIQQVLLNLLYNAADATHSQGGAIRVITGNRAISTTGEHRRVMIRVVDNGIGIPHEHLERVFDPFFTTKPAGAGAGLGLSLSQRLILSNKGTIRVDSEVGKGTRITILLPAREAASQSQSAAAGQ